jgi:hypothetical protein
VSSPSFVRRELRDRLGSDTGLALEGELARERPRIEIQARWRSLRVSLNDVALLWAHADVHGFDWIPASEPAPHALPPIDAADARSMAAKSEAPPLAWARRLAEPLAYLLLSRRTPVAWLATAVEERSQGPEGTRSARELRWVHRPRSETVPFEPGGVEWDGVPGPLLPWPLIHDDCVLPLRSWPAATHGRVSAFRKLARDGALPPVVLLWVSGLQSWLLLDGHARWVAARVEGVAMHALGVLRPTPRARSMNEEKRARLTSARASLEELAAREDAIGARAGDEANALTARLSEANAWYAIDRAGPFDETRFATEIAAAEERWRRVLHTAMPGRRPHAAER